MPKRTKKHYKGKRVLVVGMARSGVAAAGLLGLLGARVTVYDAKPRGGLSASLNEIRPAPESAEFGTPEPVNPEKYDLIVISPGVPWELPFLEKSRRAGVSVISELEFGCRLVSAPIVAITGTNGKSTTTKMLGEMLLAGGLNVFVGGNIGTPVCEGVMDEEGKWDYAVLEVSTFQLEGIESFRPLLSAILNITPDHLDRHPTFDRYRDLKARVFENQDINGYCVLNYDDPETRAIAAKSPARTYFFSSTATLADGACVSPDGKIVISRGKHKVAIMKASELPVTGAHNLENALAAALMADICGVAPHRIAAALKGYRALPHRMEHSGEISGVKFYNDSKGTNVAATVKSISGLRGIILIAGGKDKGTDFAPLGEAARGSVAGAVLIGEAAERIGAALEGIVPVKRAESMESAVATALKMAKPGYSVVLSPACSSFDMFRDYIDRGEKFRAAVNALAASVAGEGKTPDASEAKKHAG